MRVPLQGPLKNDGYYGGFGTRAAHKPWMPAARRRQGDGGPVPAKYRDLRLRKTRRSRMEPTPDYVAIPVSAVAMVFVVLGLLILLSVVF